MKNPLRKIRTNPCIQVWGPGPTGTKCGSCVFHHFVGGGTKNYPKCEKRYYTHTAKSDHSSRFPACGRYEPKPPAAESKTAENVS